LGTNRREWILSGFFTKRKEPDNLLEYALFLATLSDILFLQASFQEISPLIGVVFSLKRPIIVTVLLYRSV